MAQVTVVINGRKYPIACDDGQEAHLTRLGAYIDKRIGELVAAIGQVGDARLLVMVCLLIADELSDAYAELEGYRGTGQGAKNRAQVEDAISGGIEALAKRIDDIAERLEHA